MATNRTEVDLNRALMFKGARALVRLAMSMQGDRLLNDILPELEQQYNSTVLNGALPEATVEELLSEVASRVSA